MSCMGATFVVLDAGAAGLRWRVIIQTTQPIKSNQNKTLISKFSSGFQATRPRNTSSTKREPAYDSSNNIAPA